jgi:hypothetical protein
MMNVMKWYEPAFSGHGFRRRHELASRCTLAQEQDPKGMVSCKGGVGGSVGFRGQDGD